MLECIHGRGQLNRRCIITELYHNYLVSCFKIHVCGCINNCGPLQAKILDILEPGNAIFIKEIHYLQITIQKKIASGGEPILSEPI